MAITERHMEGTRTASRTGFEISAVSDEDARMLLLNQPEQWVVELLDGSFVNVWADSAEGVAGPEDLRDYRFSNLMDVPSTDQPMFEITGTTPSNRERVIVTVAHFPRSAVRAVHSADSETPQPA